MRAQRGVIVGAVFLGISLGILTPPGTAAEQKQSQAKSITLATTTSFDDTGLAAVLVEKFRKETGIGVKVLALGTGEALRAGREGRADVMVVHAPTAEQKLVDEGFAMDRVQFMHNTFLIVGPKADPAKVAAAASEQEAFRAIAESGKRFFSRGDKSGTHTKELAIWEKIGVKAKGQDWYVETGQGMGETLLAANELDGYTLSDIGTYLDYKGKKRIELVSLCDKGGMLYNAYSVMLVNPKKFSAGQINVGGGRKFAQFLQRKDIQQLIGDYKRKEYGQSLFVPDLLPKPKK